MNTKKRSLALLLAVLYAVTLLTGCSSAEMALYEASLKNAEMLSYQDDMEASIYIEISGMSDEDMAEIEPILGMINDSSLSMSQRMMVNEEQTMVKGAIEMQLNSPLGPMPFNIWLDVNMSDDDFSIEEIIQLPPQLMAEIPEMAGKDYMVINTEVLNEAMGMDYSNIMDMALGFEEEMETLIEEFMDNWDYSENHLSYVGRETLEGESVKVYELNMDDEEIKAWLQYFVEYSIEEGHMSTFMEGYFGMLKEAMPEMEGEAELDMIQDSIDAFMSEEGQEELLSVIEEFFDTLDEVTVLNDDGIEITYMIDSDGYLVATEGSIGLSINPKEYSEAFGQTWTMEEEPVIEVTITFSDRISEINAIEEIEFPELTLANSVDFYDLINEDMDAMKVLIDDKRVYYDEQPRMENGRTLVPLRKTAEALDMQVSWDDATQTVTAMKQGKEIKLKINDDTVYVNGEAVKIDVPARIVNGRTLIPLRFIGENLDSGVAWDAPNNAVWITTMQ